MLHREALGGVVISVSMCAVLRSRSLCELLYRTLNAVYRLRDRLSIELLVGLARVVQAIDLIDLVQRVGITLVMLA